MQDISRSGDIVIERDFFYFYIVKKILILIVTLIFSSCGNQKIGYQKLLKSSDFDLKYEMAVNYFNESNYLIVFINYIFINF